MFKRIKELIFGISFYEFIKRCKNGEYEFTSDIQVLKNIITMVCKSPLWTEGAHTGPYAGTFMSIYVAKNVGDYKYHISMKERRTGREGVNFKTLFKELFEAFAPCFEGVPTVTLGKRLQSNELLYAIQQNVQIPKEWRIFPGITTKDNLNFQFKKGVLSIANIIRVSKQHFDNIVVAEEYS